MIPARIASKYTRRGRFMVRFGALGSGAPHSTKKLCLVATDPAFLADLLYGLSLRADCWHVKFGIIPRDGMVLGRCWLETDAAVAKLCEELKGHPRLMVSLQDDAFFDAFREPDAAEGACGVWDDWPEHEADVANILQQAFGRNAEAKLVDTVRSAGCATISLCAGVPPSKKGEEWPLVGHVMFSPVSVDSRDGARGLGLAPLAVLPEHQRRGFGAELVRTGLRRARALGFQYVVVLGDPAYYGRFGFVPATDFGLHYEQPGSDAYFMALELVPGGLGECSGVVRYHAAFAEV